MGWKIEVDHEGSVISRTEVPGEPDPLDALAGLLDAVEAAKDFDEFQAAIVPALRLLDPTSASAGTVDEVSPE